MQTFGKRVEVPGGSRTAQRQRVSLGGKAITIEAERTVLISDLASKGAKLTGRDLPLEDARVLLVVGELKIAGRVAWAADPDCGLQFDLELDHHDVAEFKRQGRSGANFTIV